MALCTIAVLAFLPSGWAMGVLTVGSPLPWGVSLPHLRYVRQHGVLQFINKFNEVKDITNDELLWGDEIEYSLVALDHATRTPRISLRATEVREALSAKEALRPVKSQVEGCAWMPEYGSWMVEGTPRTPYAGYSNDLMRVERNMRLRRARLMAGLPENHVAPTLSTFPLLGVGDDFTEPRGLVAGGPVAASESIPDECINPHPRFGTLTQNIRMRRGSKVKIEVPLFRDLRTPEFKESASDVQKEETALPPRYPVEAGVGVLKSPDGLAAMSAEWPKVEMDAMAYGMGCCCTQVTFQARDMDESRYLFDQLVVLSPIFLALTAATPFFKGRLVDTDTRWATIAQCVDDRTLAERGEKEETASTEATAMPSTGPKGAASSSSSEEEWVTEVTSVQGCTTTTFTAPGSTPEAEVGVGGRAKEKKGPSPSPSPSSYMAGQGAIRLNKSRYGSVSGFIYDSDRVVGMGSKHVDKYNDLNRHLDQWSLDTLLENGVDRVLAEHIANLFVRDPLVIFEGKIEELDDGRDMDHFENIQSTNWHTVRWKPPPASATGGAHVGWRTEFRPMEVQLTDFENAAFAVLVVLVTRVLLAYDLGLYIPMTCVEENMARAQDRDAVTKHKFFFRKDIAPPQQQTPPTPPPPKAPLLHSNPDHTPLSLKSATKAISDKG